MNPGYGLTVSGALAGRALQSKSTQVPIEDDDPSDRMAGGYGSVTVNVPVGLLTDETITVPEIVHSLPIFVYASVSYDVFIVIDPPPEVNATGVT